MDTNCAPLVADLFLFCYERDFIMSLSDDKQADVIDAFNTNDIVSTKINDKRDDFDFEIVNFTFLDGDVPHSTSYGVYISLNSFVLLEDLFMLLTSTLAINC